MSDEKNLNEEPITEVQDAQIEEAAVPASEVSPEESIEPVAPVSETPATEGGAEAAAPESEAPATENTAKTKAKKPKKKLTKKQSVALGVALLAVVAIALVILIPSKFERVHDECVQIAGMVSGKGDYFTIDTKPDIYDNMDEAIRDMMLSRAQDNALEAIKYANEELGFNGSVYSQMLKTTALMGRQSEETDKYKVSWTYHPDEGLEVTYQKK